MIRMASGFGRAVVLFAGAFFCGAAAFGANGTWTGAQDALWTNSANWSASPFAGQAVNDTAVFCNAGNGNTFLDVAGLYGLTSIIFDMPDVAAYTIGAGAPASQTLVMANGGTFQLTANAAASQSFNAAVQLGHATNNASFTFRNDNPGQTLAFSKVLAPAASVANARSLNIEGVGPTHIQGDIEKGSSVSLSLNLNGVGPLTLSGNNTLTALYMNGEPSSIINLAAGTNTFANGGSGNLIAQRDAVINGPGVLRLSDGGSENYADNGVAFGKTLTINAQIIGAGFEYYHGTYSGTIVLNATNLFTGQVLINNPGTISVRRIGNRGSTDSNLGSGSYFRFSADGSGARLLYTGEGETTDRYLHFKKSLSIVEHAGTGLLNFSMTNLCDSGSKILRLQGDTSGVGEFSGALVNSAATLSLVKAGLGTWRLSAANTFSGTTAVNGGTLALTGAAGAIASSTGYSVSGGGTLLLDNTVSANNADRLRNASALTLSGGALVFAHDGGGADYSETVGAVNVTAGANTVSASQAAEGQTSTLTLTSLSRSGGTIDFTGVGLGESTRNRIIITGQSDGLIGTWATVNGTRYAAYSSANGVYASDLTVVNIDAQGSEIPDDASKDVRITAAGSGDAVTLAGATENSVFRLRQETDTAATVATAGKTLKAARVEIAAGQADLTLGAASGDGTLVPLAAGGVLSLQNDEPAALLTVNAAVANNTSASTVEKSGDGKVLLNAVNTFGGTTWINSGTLAIGGASAQTLSGTVNGAGALRKEGAGRLTLSGANTYTGLTVVSAGTLVVQNNNALGAKTAGTVVESGATLDLGGTLGANTLYLYDEAVTVGGTGVGGRGAIINASATSQYNALTKVALTAPTTFGGEHKDARWDIRTTTTGSAATLDMNGFDIVKVGSNYVGLTAAEVTPGAGNIDVQEGFFTVEVGTRLNGSAANTLTVRGGAVFDIYNLYYPILWSLTMEDNARFYARAGNVPYWNVWDGPVALNGRAVFDSGSYSATVRGNISGEGSLVKIGSGTVYLRGSNTYGGLTTVSNGTLYVQSPAALPGYDEGRLTLIGSSTLAMHAIGGGTGWSAADIRDLHDATTFPSATAVLSIDTTFSSLDYGLGLSKAVSLTKQGNNTLTITAPVTTASPLRSYGGETRFTTASHSLGTVYVGNSTLTLDGDTYIGVVSNSCYVGESSAHFGRMTVKDNAVWSGFLYPYDVVQSTLVIGQSGRGILTIQDNASVTQRLIVGNNSGSAGAVYQNGGRMHNWGGARSDPRVGENGYGYYELNSGTFTNNGYFQIGRQFASVGIVRQTGGAFEMGTVYGGQLGISRGGTGVVVLAGGTFATGPSAVNANPTIDIGNASDYGTINGFAELTLAGTADADANAYINMADRTNMFACLNLNGGRLTAKYISKANRANSTGLVNFNGGTFRARQAGNLFSTGVNTPTAVNIYAGGATFEVTNNLACAVPVPLRAPAGQGVVVLSVAPTPGYIGPPMVTITGGGGTGATAVATFDSASGTLTGIEITSPGYGYTSLPTVTLGGGGTNAHPPVTGVTLGQNVGGGLTKIGGGTLTLSSTNTYAGPTVVKEGTLRLGLLDAFPVGTDISAEGGTFDLGNFTVTGGTFTAASGYVVSGALACDSMVKTGEGDFALAVPLVSAQPLVVESGTLLVRRAGLWEGAVYGSFQTTSNNPATAVQLTTRMANTTAGWPITNTFVYTGILWNRSSAPVTWTFAENVDDNVLLKINGETILNNMTWNAPTIGTVTLDPGPHTFEARFGQGGGGAGPVNSSWWTTTAFGFGVDYQGRGETIIGNYVPLVDPGDGSLLTLDGAALTNQLDVSTVLHVAGGAVVDFDLGVQTLAGLSGSGVVTNGTLTVTGDIAPGGEGTVGTLTVAADALALSGRLLVDVTSGGDCDRLVVAGDLDLSALSLEIVNAGALDRYKTYTLMTVGGTRTGTFASVTLDDPKWYVSYKDDGSVQLIFPTGTVILMR